LGTISYTFAIGEPEILKRTFIQFPPALRYRPYALLWTGLLVSIAGSQMQNAALLWHLRTLSDRPVVVSGIGLMRFLPILLFAPFGGVAADSFNRRRILFITQSTMAVTAFLLGLLTWLGHITIWQIYLISAVQAVAVSFDMPARQALVPNLVPREILPSAFGLQSIAMNTGSIVGPALCGLVIGYLGQEYTYLINAASFLAVLAALFAMGPIAQETRAAVRGIKDSLASILEGARFIFQRPIILSSMLLDFIATFFSSANTLLPFVARDILHVNEIAYGWLVASESIGAVAVGLFFSQRTQVRRQGKLLLAAVVAFGLATVLLGFATSFAMAMLALILVGVGDSVSTILRNTIRQLQTPDYIRGRMVSLNAIFFQGGPQLGEIEAGLAAQAFGIPFAIISGGIGCIIGVVAVALRWPQLRRYSGEETVTA
jgi:MFS family permease